MKPDPAVLESRWRWYVKRFTVGRMAAAVRRQRRAPINALRARSAEAGDRRAGRLPRPPARRTATRTVVMFPSGPRRWQQLADSIQAVQASDGDATQILVVDDSTVDTRESVIRARFPEVDVIRKRYPSGGPPATWQTYRLGLLHALKHYDFELFVKMDTDAVVTGPGFSDAVAARLDAAPQAGLAGCYGQRCDGTVEDTTYHAAVLEREAPRDATLRSALGLAETNGWRRGAIVHGGVQCLTRPAVEALASEGWLAWRRPWHSQASDDFVISMFVKACGFDLLSIGGPNGIFAVDNNYVLLPKEEVANGPWVATHSTRHGVGGEEEEELRSYFRARRAEWDPGGATRSGWRR